MLFKASILLYLLIYYLFFDILRNSFSMLSKILSLESCLFTSLSSLSPPIYICVFLSIYLFDWRIIDPQWYNPDAVGLIIYFTFNFWLSRSWINHQENWKKKISENRWLERASTKIWLRIMNKTIRATTLCAIAIVGPSEPLYPNFRETHETKLNRCCWRQEPDRLCAAAASILYENNFKVSLVY